MSPHSDRVTARHAEAQDVLPWLANGTLAGAELERVQAHVETCADCRADLAALRTVRAAGPALQLDPDLDVDPNRALARLLPRLDDAVAVDDDSALPACAPSEVQPAAAAPGLLQRWRDRFAANDGAWLRAAVAAQCGVIAVLAVLLARPAAHTDTADAYRVLGAGGANGAARLVVTFRPDTPERELRRIVRASGGRIVGGPTVTDAWLIGADGQAAPVLARLRAEPAVTLAEPLTMDGRP